jgi:mono/diheme cytochrome c family protein
MPRKTFALVVLSLLLAGIGIGSAVAQTSPTLRGEAIAKRLCARCHATGMTDDSPVGRAPAFRDLSKRYPVEHLAEALAEGIVTGHSSMPQFTFEPDDIDALLSYLRGLSRQQRE